jgi:hypothetical protein
MKDQAENNRSLLGQLYGRMREMLQEREQAMKQ